MLHYQSVPEQTPLSADNIICVSKNEHILLDLVHFFKKKKAKCLSFPFFFLFPLRALLLCCARY